AAVVAISLSGATPAVDVIRPPRLLAVDAAYLPPPEPIDYPTTGGRTAHALVYRPANPNVEPPQDERPPLITLVHGGPTSAARPSLQLDIRFWTSRGVTVADVN